jgi:putative membrane protein
LIPGIHINTIAELLLSLGLSGFFGVLFLYFFYSIFVVFEGIYSIILNIPDSHSAILPTASQKLVVKGKATEAIYSYFKGGLMGALYSIILFPFAFFLIPLILPIITEYLLLVLIFSVSYILLNAENKKGIFIFLLAGIFGYFVLNIQTDLNLIFPMFVGFFTIPALMIKAQKVSIQNMNINEIKVNKKTTFIAVLASIIVFLIPGVATPTQIIILAGIFSQFKEEDYISAIGAINSAAIFYSLMMLNLIGRARTGVAIIAREMMETDLFSHILIGISSLILFTLFVYLVSRNLKRIVDFVSTFNHSYMKYLLLLYLIFMSYLITGAIGILVLGFASLIGTLTLKLKADRTNLMGSIILNSILYYFNKR